MLFSGPEHQIYTARQPIRHRLFLGVSDLCSGFSAEIGWHAKARYPSPANVYNEFIERAFFLVREPTYDLVIQALRHNIDATMVMSYSITINAQAVKLLSAAHLGYPALFHPHHRRSEVLKKAANLESFYFIFFDSSTALYIASGFSDNFAISIVAEYNKIFNRRAAKSILLKHSSSVFPGKYLIHAIRNAHKSSALFNGIQAHKKTRPVLMNNRFNGAHNTRG